MQILREIIRLNITQEDADDVDHLGNRRVRAVGELIQGRFRVGLARMERIIKDRMSTQDIDALTPGRLINARPVIGAIREFFMSSQLSQFMDQTNPLAELEHKRRLSAMGPGGLSRERAGFEVRDVHPTHYGRICPIATPEGPNIGLIGHLSSYAIINDYGFIETPYRKVVKEEKDGKTVARVTDEIEWVNAFTEERSVTIPATVPFDEKGYLTQEFVSGRKFGEPKILHQKEVDFIDVSSKQIVSIGTALIPFWNTMMPLARSWAQTCNDKPFRPSNQTLRLLGQVSSFVQQKIPGMWLSPTTMERLQRWTVNAFRLRTRRRISTITS